MEPSQKNVVKSISLDPQLLRAAKVWCAQHDLGFSQFVSEAIQAAVGRKNIKPQAS